MPTKTKKQDRKLLATAEKYELNYVTRTWFSLDGKPLPMKVLKEVIGKIGRSRRAVYVVLRYLNYKYVAKKK